MNTYIFYILPEKPYKLHFKEHQATSRNTQYSNYKNR